MAKFTKSSLINHFTKKKPKQKGAYALYAPLWIRHCTVEVKIVDYTQSRQQQKDKY